MTKNKVHLSFIILILIFMTMSVGYSLLKESFSINGSASLKKEQTGGGDFAYELDVSLSKWSTGNYEYQYNPFTLKYLGDVDTTSWNIVFDVPDDATLSSCWNVICVLKDGYLTLHSNTTNSILKPSQTLTNFGFQMNTSMENYQLNTQKVNFYTETYPNPLEVELTEGITVTKTKGNGWGDGDMFVSQFSLTINNDSGVDLNSWQIEIAKPTNETTISNVWGCEYIEKDDRFILVGSTNSKTIINGGSQNMGLQVKLPTQEDDLEILRVFGRGIVIES